MALTFEALELPKDVKDVGLFKSAYKALDWLKAPHEVDHSQMQLLGLNQVEVEELEDPSKSSYPCLILLNLYYF